LRQLLKLLIAPEVRDAAGLRRYVAVAVLAAVVAALLMDVANQMAFFIDWTTAIRSWIVTLVVALLIATPLLTWIGRAHLALYQAKLKVEQLSRTDPLTGLPNRRALLEEAERMGATLMVLVIIDIDHFKKVNDTYGHRAGDTVLRRAGQIMANSLAGCGTLGRVGGEEFALVSNGPSPPALLERLGSLRDRLAAHPMVTDGQTVTITISVGAALRHQQSFDELYSEADRALYAAKRSGRNRICLSPHLQSCCEAAEQSAA